MNMFSTRLRASRKRKNLSQEQLAKLVNTTKATISNYENQYSTPSNDTLVKLANILETTTDYLLGRTDQYAANTLTNEINPKKATEMTQAEMEKWINHPNIHPTWKGRQLSADELITLKRVLKALFEKESSDADHLG
jgi:transcriptional regulator with XRE-family HTH domain